MKKETFLFLFAGRVTPVSASGTDGGARFEASVRHRYRNQNFIDGSAHVHQLGMSG